MTRTWRNYAPTEQAAREFRQACKAYLFCPTCGASEQCVDTIRSQTSIVMRCLGCRLRYHVRRSDLAASVRTKAAATDDPKERALLERLAALFEPYTNPRYTYRAQPPADVDA